MKWFVTAQLFKVTKTALHMCFNECV